MSLNSKTLDKMLNDYEWSIKGSKQAISEKVDLSHIDQFNQIVVVKVKSKYIAIPADAGTIEKDILRVVESYGR